MLNATRSLTVAILLLLTSSLSSFCFNFSKSSFLSSSSPSTAFKFMANCCDFSMSLLLQLCPAPPLPLPVVCLHFKNVLRIKEKRLQVSLGINRKNGVVLPSRCTVACYAATFAVMLSAELSTASTPSTAIVWAYLTLCCSVVTSRCFHVEFSSRPILICIPGCFKLNLSHFTSIVSNSQNTQIKCEWRMVIDNDNGEGKSWVRSVVKNDFGRNVRRDETQKRKKTPTWTCLWKSFSLLSAATK